MGESSRYLSCAETAKLIRVALKAAFPATKFSVRSSTYAGGASIRVGWVDGPTVRLVNTVAKDFEGGGFDGSIDLKFNYDHWLLPDGSTTVAYSPGTSGSLGYYEPIRNNRPHDDAELVHFGADYVFTERKFSLEFAKKLAAQVATYWGVAAPELVESKWGGWTFADEGMRWKMAPEGASWGQNGSGDHYSWNACINRAAEDATAFTHSTEAA